MIESFIYKILNLLINRPLIKIKLKKYGKNFKFGYHSEIKNMKYFSFGDNFFSGAHGYFSTNKYVPVTIGNDVMFGPFCKIIGGDHDLKYTDNHIRYAPEPEVKDKSIVIEDGVWIGANTTILTNSFICEGAIISSGAIVRNFIPPYCIAYGVPAKQLKRRFNNQEIDRILKNIKSKYSKEQILNYYEEYNVY